MSRSRADDQATGQRYYPRSFDERRALLHRLDPHFASLWETYLTGLMGRDRLDARTRLLVLIGQYTMRQHSSALAETIDAAFQADLDPKEVLEVILQCYVYGGEAIVLQGVDVFARIAEQAGRLEEVEARGLTSEAVEAGRNLEADRASWSEDDRDDPRLQGLLDRYGWQRMSDALRLRPGSLINSISYLDVLDPAFLRLWLEVVWAGMYGRRVLDDKTRILCIVGNCIAVGDTFQYTRHMQGALREGATPNELLEIVFQSCHITGHPLTIGIVINDLLRLLDELGRLEEVLEDPSRVDDFRKVLLARIAMRGSVQDLSTAAVGLDQS